MLSLPAGVPASDATARIARDSSGAPALPEGLTALSSICLVTPHIPSLGVPAIFNLPFSIGSRDAGSTGCSLIQRCFGSCYEDTSVAGRPGPHSTFR